LINEASKVYDTIVQTDPSCLDAIFKSGICSAQLGDHRKALDLFAVGLVQSPTPKWYYNSGKSYTHLEQYILAKEAFAASIAVAPTEESYIALLNIHSLLSEASDIETLSETALSIYPQSTHILHILAKSQLHSNLPHKASSTFSRILALIPTDRLAILNLGNLLVNTGNYDKALEYYFTLPSPLDTDDVELLHHIGSALYGKSKGTSFALLNKAFQYLNQALSLNPLSHQILHTIGLISQSQAKHSAAAQYLSTSYKIQEQSNQTPLLALTLSHLAISLGKIGDHSAATFAFEKSCETGDTAVLLNYIVFLVESKNLREARERFEVVRSIEKDFNDDRGIGAMLVERL